MSMSDMRVNISSGNTKMGSIPSVSLRPVLDCASCAQCRGSCYALKAWRMYAAVRQAYSTNSDIAHSDRLSYFRDIHDYVQSKRPEYFRWHVAGDILDQEYYAGIAAVARFNPRTKFLVFTKRHDLDFSDKPKNLTVVMSCWPGMSLPSNKLPRAYMQDGSETRIPRTARECPGSCTDCKLCYGLKGSVVFHKH